MRFKDLKTFLKKVAQPLDNLSIVIYVTRITTDATTVFVSSSACNPSFGQGYAHQPIGEKAMKNQNASANINPVADENGNINCTNCENCKNCADCLNCTNCTECTDCIDCIDCKDCEDCKNCANCANCKDCTDCVDCVDCDYCEDCTDCAACDDCRECTSYAFCDNCRNCGGDRTQDSDENELGAE